MKQKKMLAVVQTQTPAYLVGKVIAIYAGNILPQLGDNGQQ